MSLEEEDKLDIEIAQLHEELLKFKVDEKNLKIALRILEEQQLIEFEYRQRK
jgi:hypothetical protein